MRPNRLDDLFQIKGGIPIICGLYIGMDKYDAEEILYELEEDKKEHSYDYPADLIYEMQIKFVCEYFPDSENVKSISLSFTSIGTSRDVEFIRKYMQEKYYHEREDEFLQKNADGIIMGYMIDLYNDFYRYSIYSSDDDAMTICVSATSSDEFIYHAFNTISRRSNVKNFIKQSLFLLEKAPESPEQIEKVMPIRYGLPSFLGCYLGDPLLYGTSFGKLDEWTDDEFDGIPMKEEYGISYEFDIDVLNRVTCITLNMPTDYGGVWPIINYLKNNLIINTFDFDVKNDEYGNLEKITGYLQNEFILITILDISDKYNKYTQINISARDEDNIQIYQAFQTVFENENVFIFFDGIDKFYEDGKDTQDARFNKIRNEFKTFKDFLDDYTGTKAAYAHDMGGYSEDEFKRDKQICIEAWNTPGAERPMSWVDIGYR